MDCLETKEQAKKIKRDWKTVSYWTVIFIKYGIRPQPKGSSSKR